MIMQKRGSDPTAKRKSGKKVQSSIVFLFLSFFFLALNQICNIFQDLPFLALMSFPNKLYKFNFKSPEQINHKLACIRLFETPTLLP